MKYIILSVFAITLAMCHKDPASNGSLPLNQEVQIANNTILTNPDENIQLKMVRVTEDSRCPETADCIWMGDGVPQFTFTAQGKESTFNLHTSLTLQDTTIYGYNIRLVKLNPYPQTPEVIPQSSYVSTVIVSKKD